MSKICSKCHIEKELKEFSLTYAKCKSCRNDEGKVYRKTLDGCLSTLLLHARQTAEKRNKITNRNDQSGEFNLTIDKLKNIYNKQDGKCYWSELTMTFNGTWKISLERIDPTNGYTSENCVLCCLELNGQSQWNQEKLLEMINILDKNITSNIINFETETEKKKLQKAIFEIIEDIKYYKCLECNELKELELFVHNRKTICKDCYNIQQKEYYNTPYGSLRRLIDNAIFSSKQRKSKINENRDNTVDFNIDVNYLINTFIKQNGLCAYSNLPLQFGNSKEINWKCSLERIDVTKDYIKDNICLICLEFQASDFSIIMKDKQETTTGWTREKFILFENSLRNKLIN
jgi:hypothetical protein